MSLTLPYPTYTPFSPTTVHDNVAHNTPHAGLLSNDVAIAAALNALDVTVTSLTSSALGIRYKAAYTAGPMTLPASYADFVSMSITKQSATSILFVIGKYEPFINQESFLFAGANGIIAKDGTTIADSETQFYHYSGGATNSYGCLVPFALITGVAAGAHTISLQVKYVAGSYTANLRAYLGSLMAFEILNASAM